MNKVQVLFLSHYFPPEVNAPASRTYEHCVRWAREGHDVTVVTCVPNCPAGVVFDGYRGGLRPRTEIIDGIRVVRVPTFIAANAGTVRRIVNYLSYMFSALLVSLVLPRPDVVVATSPQFFCGWAGVLTKWLRRVPFVLEIRDIWPDSLAAVGALRNRRLLSLLEVLERRMYRAADHIVTVGEGYRGEILARADVADRITVVENGADLDRFAPVPRDFAFRRHWGIGDETFVCSYVGTIGMAHGLHVVAEAAELLRESGRDDVRFLIVGDGARRSELIEEIRRRRLESYFVLTGQLPKDVMPRVLAASDCCLVHLRSCQLFETVLPSKIFEAMAMERPIVMGVGGLALEIVERAGAGLEMEPESASSLVACLERLADDPTLGRDLGRSGRELVAARYSREVLAGRYLRILSDVIKSRPPRTPIAPVEESVKLQLPAGMPEPNPVSLSS